MSERAMTAIMGQDGEAVIERWCDRSHEQWALRSTGGRDVVLMTRHADSDGLNMDGDPAPWKDVATFVSYFEARKVYRYLSGRA